MIYFMQSVDGGPVKIGCTGDLKSRHQQLEAYYGRPLALLATMDGGLNEEAKIHSRFAHLRLKGTGRRGNRLEQFRPEADLMAFIGRPLLVGANPDAAEAMEPVGFITIINLKGTEEFRDWLASVVEKSHIPASTITRLAYEAWAKQNGYPKPPKI